jgi:hypothetical protein
MKALPAVRTFAQASCIALSVALIPGHVFAQAQPAPAAPAPASNYTPEVGQQGKDVVWVPTAQALVDRMLDMAKVTPNDILVDLGSGDGRTVITAAKRGLNARGVEYNPDMVALSRANAAKEGVGGKANFIQGDIFETNFSDATVVTLFLLPQLNLRLRPIILEMKPGTRVVSNSFDMGDWQADQRAEAGSTECTSYCRAFLWIVPAKVEGSWKMQDGQLTLKQTFQNLTGTMTASGSSNEISNAKMNGDSITFTAGGKTYTGKVEGNSIKGEGWSATRG